MEIISIQGQGGAGVKRLMKFHFVLWNPSLRCLDHRPMVLLLRCNCHFHCCHLNIHIEDSNTCGVSLSRNKICGICYSAGVKSDIASPVGGRCV